MTTPLRSADAELQTLVTFRSRHRAAIDRAFQRARADSDVELPLPVFSLRLFEACELVFGDAAASRSQIGRLIDALYVADLYLATAAGEGDAEAQRLLRRWYAPLLVRRAGPGAEALEAALLAATGPSAPLAHYFGLCPLARWLGAAATSAMPSAPPAIGLRELSFAGSELRRNLDVTAGRVLNTCASDVRFALALLEVAGAEPESVAVALHLGVRRLRRIRRQVAGEVVRAVEALFAASGAGRGARREAWLRIAGAVVGGAGLTTARRRPLREGIAAAMVRASLRQAVLAPRVGPCPERNRLLATLEPALRLNLEPVLQHAAACWPCLESATAALRAASPPTEASKARRNGILAAAVAAVAIAGLLLWQPTLRWPHPTPAKLAQQPAEASTPTPDLAALPSPETEVIAQLPDLRDRGESVFAPPVPVISPAPDRAPPPPRTPVRERVATPDPRPPTPAPTMSGGVAILVATPSPSPQAAEPEAPTPATQSTPEARVAARTPALRSAVGSSSAARLVNLAVGRYREGEERRAIDILQRAIEMAPDLAVAHLDCATLFDRVGERERAAIHWSRFLKLAPDDDAADYARQRVAAP